MTKTICYRENDTGEEYLAYLSFQTLEQASRDVNNLNINKPEKLFNGEPALCDRRTYFLSAQEED